MQSELTFPAVVFLRRKCWCTRHPSGSPRHRRALVYFVRAGDWVKIGTTHRRHWQAFKGTLLGIMPGHYDVERWVHDRFDHLRHPGSREFFEASPDLLAFIEAFSRPLDPRDLLGRPR